MVRVLFLHPDLGIGGAERLIVDAALALKAKGHDVHIVTAHHDPMRCFPETADGTVPVSVSGSWIPRSLLGRFLALFAYLRMMWAALYVTLFSSYCADVFICDQVSACIPVLRLFSHVPILFYCHFPDLLLSSRKSLIQQIYRAPLDWIEEKTTGMATKIVVNSKFTAGIFHETFTTLRVDPEVLYPSLNFDAFDKPVDSELTSTVPELGTSFTFLSINRYERKKNLGLALKAFAQVCKQTNQKVHLVMAGGYDERVIENVEYYEELRQLADDLELGTRVTFLRSPNDDIKLMLLKKSNCLLYTPDKEHFGIVPLEAMYCGLPVIAVNSGGPLETVADGETGFLCNPDEESFSLKMLELMKDPSLGPTMGRSGTQRVKTRFSFESFSSRLDNIVKSIITK